MESELPGQAKGLALTIPEKSCGRTGAHEIEHILSADTCQTARCGLELSEPRYSVCRDPEDTGLLVGYPVLR
jgi:hypothetical protein